MAMLFILFVLKMSTSANCCLFGLKCFMESDLNFMDEMSTFSNFMFTII